MHWGVAALCVLFVACSDGAGPDAGVEGTYHLRTVKGEPLPYVWRHTEFEKIEVLKAEYQLNAGGSYTYTVRQRESPPGYPQTWDASTTGTWLQNGDSITFTPSDQRPPFSAGYSRNKLTFGTAENPWVYTR